MDFPTDTLVDTDPSYDDMDNESAVAAKIVMKSIYLSHPVCKVLRKENGLSNTEIIDTFETLRRNGSIMIRWHEAEDYFTIDIIRPPESFVPEINSVT